MSDNCIPVPINFRQWVLSVEDGPNRKQRQAIEIALNTIASCDNLFKTCSLKGGILMGLRYGSPRFTVDIDLSISKMPRPETPEEIRKLLDSQFEYIALDLGYPDILMRVHSIKKLPRKKFDEATFPGLQLKLTFVDKKMNVSSKLSKTTDL
ncbi:nucleotidyl transferase AbiEii/AbiGii toxin family protein [Litorimonas haliclonae]|uniref:nucleotidyl transferase AbiEii/AbiGii toxin family protein n=1 Tax=Litorimonas haliclonae TaxID=2081977 RepID=UPI0039EF9ED3